MGMTKTTRYELRYFRAVWTRETGWQLGAPTVETFESFQDMRRAAMFEHGLPVNPLRVEGSGRYDFQHDVWEWSPVAEESADEIIKVCADGFVITRVMVEAEIARTEAAAREPRAVSTMYVIGVNASSNMFA